MVNKIKFSLGVFGLFLLFVNFAFAATFNNPSSGIGASQYYQPSFDTYYSSEQMSTYWPILDSMKNGQCQASNDFLVAIPPLGCTPSVVRSDLLEEQNVPVFCQLDALQVNPLIKVSSIESISFKGDYPAEVAGISFHPARAAVNTRETLLGSPVLNNVGYVVIILKRTEAEKNMPDLVKGNLTATIKYDAEKAFGVGRAEFLLPLISDENWQEESKAYSFWSGRGYVRLLSTDGITSEIGLYTDQDRLLQKVSLKVGETSNEIFFPGFYCKAGLQVRLNGLDAAVDKVRLSVDGEDVWATKGTKLLNGKCTVNSLIPAADGTGSVSISCPSQKFDLILSSFGANFNINGKDQTINVGKLVERGNTAKEDLYLAYVGKLPDKVINEAREFTVLVKSDRVLDSKYLARVVSAVNLLAGSAKQLTFDEFQKLLIAKIGKTDSVQILINNGGNFKGVALATDNAKELAANVQSNLSAARQAIEEGFTYENEKDLTGAEFTKVALQKYAESAKEQKQFTEQKWALQTIVEKYPASLEARNAQNELDLLDRFDISNAGKAVYVNNKYSYILAKDFKPVTSDVKNVDLNVASGLGEGREVCLDGQNKTDERGVVRTCSSIRVNKISPAYVDLSFAEYSEKLSRYSSNKSVRLYGDSNDNRNSQVLGGVTVYVREINVEEEVSVSLIPKVDNTKTEANFTFNIGIEKRSIELSPEKTKQMISALNKSISDWQDRVDKLGKLVTAWKGACFATSAFMVMSNFASGLSGESIARKNVMSEFKIICEQKVAQKEFATLSKCYSDAKISKQIDDAVKAGTTSVTDFNKEIKQIEQNSMKNGVINQTLLKENMLNPATGLKGLPPNAKDMTTEQIKEYLFWNNQNTAVTSSAELKAQAQSKIDSLNKAVSDYAKLNENSDKGIISRSGSSELVAIQRSGSEYDKASSVLKVESPKMVQVIEGIDKQTYYVVIENETAKSDRFKPIAVYASSDTSKNLLPGVGTAQDAKSNPQTRAVLDISGLRFVNSSCNNAFKAQPPTVKYYTVGVDKYLPALVPFNKDKGWYVKVAQGGGGILSSTTNAYQASGAVSSYTICNVGSNGLEENGLGDDVCQEFNTNNNVNEFGGCEGLSKSDVTTLKAQAQRAISNAANQYGKQEVIINAQKYNSMLTSATDDLVGCYNFMSPSQCNILFNVCDPVICPTSRCNLGGKYPVSNVVQSGIIGSLLLCLPNFPEVKVPICLTGVHAGLETYLSILKSEQSCLQENLDSGKTVGICDEITSVYKCEFFWNQVAPIASSLVPTMFEMATGQTAAKGGAEYLSVKSSWENMQGSIDYFKNSYAQNSFNAFKFKNIQEVGSEFCRANLGTSIPGGADLADGLLAPESPYQFYANFDESVFSDATVPATSQYKVYYHIFAGNDQGVRYSVYLQSPPDSAYYHSNPMVAVKTGYVTKGESADEAIDFTAPAGYKELCVMINAQVECGFKTVSTSMAANYLTDKYVATQASQTGISSEKECISGSPSVLALTTSPNIQAGAQGAINPDVSLNGIVRVCATANPGKTTNPDNWQQVGNCGNEKMICWLDKRSVNESVSKVNAVEGVTLGEAEKVTNNLEANTRESYSVVASKLVTLAKGVETLKDISGSTSILSGLDVITAGKEGASDNQLANAWLLKTALHLKVINFIIIPVARDVAADLANADGNSADLNSLDTGVPVKIIDSTPEYTVGISRNLRDLSANYGIGIDELIRLNPSWTKYRDNVQLKIPVGTVINLPEGYSVS